ncbi:hypothetical protein KGY64_06910 [Candidatus Bipolaricaulota bacterium]|nr:hypothetical protein [Candidatus Bipolaricaulota bacterium]
MEEKSFVELVSYLGEDAKRKITKSLIESFANRKDLAEEIGCSYSTIKKWASGTKPGERYLSEIVKLDFERTNDAQMIVAKEYLRFQSICNTLGIGLGGGSRLSRFFDRVNADGVKILHYLYKNGNARINELSELIDGASHSEVIRLMRKVINEEAEKIFGDEIVEFRESAVNQESGDVITFAWWLTQTGLEVLKPDKVKDNVEAFQGDRELTIVYGSAGKEYSNPETETSVKNGILTIKVSGGKA